jgi:hypothetical protein
LEIDLAILANNTMGGMYASKKDGLILTRYSQITTRQSDRRPQVAAEVVRRCVDKININFLVDMPESTKNTIFVGAVGLGLLVDWPDSVAEGVQLKFL